MRQILWTLIIGAFFLTACSKTSSDHTSASNNDNKQEAMVEDPNEVDDTQRTDPEEVESEETEPEKTEEEEVVSATTYTLKSDCEFSSRKSTGSIENQEATVKTMAGSQVLIWFDVSTKEKRVYVCPQVEGLKDGATVTFSGTLKEILPNERRPATPFVLTTIQ